MSVTIIHDSRHTDGTRLRTFAYEGGNIEHVATHADGQFAASLHVRYRALVLHAAYRWDEDAEPDPTDCAFIGGACHAYYLGTSAADDVVALGGPDQQLEGLRLILLDYLPMMQERKLTECSCCNGRGWTESKP